MKQNKTKKTAQAKCKKHIKDSFMLTKKVKISFK